VEKVGDEDMGEETAPRLDLIWKLTGTDTLGGKWVLLGKRNYAARGVSHTERVC